MPARALVAASLLFGCDARSRQEAGPEPGAPPPRGPATAATSRSTRTSAGAPSPHPAHGRGALLKELRARIQRAKALPKDAKERVVVDIDDLDVKPLVGMTRAQIAAALGDPGDCESTCSPPAPGCSQYRMEDCPTAYRWGYSFYRSPRGGLGGGPELHLSFQTGAGAPDVCTSARTLHTR